MKCAWQAYLNLLPQWMREQVDRYGKESLQELRLRVGQPPVLVLMGRHHYLNRIVSEDDLNHCINMASRYSPWTSPTAKYGYITAQGGHRIGICGVMSNLDGKVSTVSTLTSLCMRVARDFIGVAAETVKMKGSVLIIGSPGRGKTTLLRDMIRQKSNHTSAAVAVVDERCELFPVVHGSFCFSPGQHTDVLSGCCKADGIEMLIRTMNPRYVAVDEITAVEDSQAIIRAIGCGVEILATAHAENFEDFINRPAYKPLVKTGLFKNIIVMQSDMSWKTERVNI